MKLTDKIQSHFFKTRVFKGLLSKYVQEPNSLVVSKFLVDDKIKESLEQKLPELIETRVADELYKAELLKKKEAMRYRVPWNINSNTNPDHKSGGAVPFSYLRRMANSYPIARACINRRIRQITQLEWDITTIDEIEDQDGYASQIKQVKDMLKHPMGNKTRMREFFTIIIDDILTIDAISFEFQKTRGGDFMYFVPVDPTTIALRVTETGATPEPPEAAYVQFIQGQEIARFTTDEMVYDMLGNRSYSPYGFSPLESLIIQVESALRGAMYNLNYFKESNVPDGFIYLPDDVASSKTQVEEWQMWFDAIVQGDPRFMHKLKVMPGGSKYEGTRKPEDMAFERFEMWLLAQTCMMFDVAPRDIGITDKVNKASDETQSELSRERGLIPLSNFIKEFLDDIIQYNLGAENLQFIWRNINPVDRKEEVEIAEKEINMGALSVDEYMIEQGREPVGLDQYVKTSQGVLMVKDIISGKAMEDAEDKNKDASNEKDDGEVDDEEKEKLQTVDIRKWRKCIYKDLENAKPLRTRFPSKYIDASTHEEIAKALEGVTSKHQAKLLFDEYLNPEVKASMLLLKHAAKLRELEYDVTPSLHKATN